MESKVKFTITCTFHNGQGHKDFVATNVDEITAQDELPFRCGNLLRDDNFVAATIIAKDAIWHITKESPWQKAQSSPSRAGIDG
jgi:hypothetical protein